MFIKQRNYLVLAAAFISFLLSVSLWFAGLEREGIFVGIWVPSILAFGVFINTMVEKG